ncbi:hypothetical protein QYE76_046785 [Lolium multiflorum]|uniref:DUF4220 domain-containing protein n=1 Tax=Lolium multiflorum TaxID=4521 RepID=A0AAD8WYP3_LOLMU|nr:hypothetical protein QYE76_046785 [Lolium multiflorum]
MLILTELLRHVSGWPLLSAALSAILWLLYQTADDVAIYVLGHMSLSSRPREEQQLMAFWASLLLVHLGGQDTVTAYAMEDNDLWLRHLFTLMVQAAGAAYVLYKYAGGGSAALLAAAVLMYLVGVGKYLQRVYALKSSRLGSVKEFLEGFEVHEPDKPYPVPACLDDAEGVLQGAHDLLHVCMGQLVDYKVWPSGFQMGCILAYHDRRGNPSGRSKLLELLGMQLSLTRDILYTKTAVTHTWHGFVSRLLWTVSTIVAFFLFRQFAMGGGQVYSKGDMVVTYILLAGALLLEASSLLRVVSSTWTCAWLQGAARFKWFHPTWVYLRRGAKVAQRCRKWSSSIGQHDLSRSHRHNKAGGCYWIASRIGLGQQWNRLRSCDSIVISHDVEDLLLNEVQRMVEACGGNDEEHIMRSPDQLALGAWGTGGSGARFYDGVVGVEEAGFNGSILAWHYATDAFLGLFDRRCILPADGNKKDDLQDETERQEKRERQQRVAEAIRVLSRYMMFLLVERPRLLPSPFRHSQYDDFCSEFQEFSRFEVEDDDLIPDALQPAVRLAKNMLARSEVEGVEEVLRAISMVWVEKLCYAASHCINNSHARQLSSGTEFITVAWILTTALFNRFYRDHPVFKEQADHFLQRH